jgi:hypothetical protein
VVKKYSQGIFQLIPILLLILIIPLLVYAVNKFEGDIRNRAASGEPTPRPLGSCSSTTVSGGKYGGMVNGKALYSVSSGASITLTAVTTPANLPVNWKIATFSSRLPNGGKFSVNNVVKTVFTAPINSSGLDQGVEIRGDISEYPKPWLYCPPITIAVHTAPAPRVTPIGGKVIPPPPGLTPQ